MHEGPAFPPPFITSLLSLFLKTQSLLDAIGGSKGFADIKPFGTVETAVLESTQRAEQILASPPQQPSSGP